MSLPSRVVVTGIGARSGFGPDVDALWHGLLEGRAAGGCAAPVELRAEVRTPGGRRIDHVSLLALAAARAAVADAAVPGTILAGPRCGLVLGTALGNMTETTAFLDRVLERGTGNPLVFPNLVANAPLSYASIELGIVGPTAMVTEQEASGEVAIALGARWVEDGLVDVCMVGASDELAAVVSQVVAETRGAAGRERGEGAGVLVLEAEPHARARGARILARLEAPVTRSVPCPVHGWPRDVEALAAVLRPGLEGVDAVALATDGSQPFAATEGRALARALEGRPVLATALRGAIGTFGAAGAVTAVAIVLALAAGVLPATIGWTGPDHPLDLVRDVPRQVPLRAVALLGLARGGLCQILRFERV